MDAEKMVGSLIIDGAAFPNWKLYNNPDYSQYCNNDSPQHHQHCHYNCIPPHNVSTNSSVMDCEEFDLALAHVRELKAELEFERRMRRKVESANKVLAMELEDERKARETAEALCKMLEEEARLNQEKVEYALKEIEEERRMLRVAEAWREERVQMKLAEAKLLMEEKLREMRGSPCKLEAQKRVVEIGGLCEYKNSQHSQSGQHGQQRREAENPHIRRGIKGFVEFPKVIKVQAKEGRVDFVTNLECQRAQLRVLLRHKSPSSLGLVSSSDYMVV
ncbi:protein BRANCHLESS TRICHOME-like [Typha latifolia]|uniref:protein BRANCHLESS TRICHOME-like n=1 Tax=Typha latifolia TaxID=4733 RepID=UPI003C2EF183